MEGPPSAVARALPFAVLLVLLVAAAVWLRGGEAAVEPGTTPTAPADRTPASAAGTEVPSPASDAASATVEDPANARTNAARPAIGAEDFVVRGRCVDEEGRPLAGCAAVLIRRPGQSEAWNTWRRQNPKAELPPPVLVQTKDDGEFEVAATAAEAFAVVLRAVRSDYVPVHATLGSPAREARIEVGDVVLPRGVRIVGRVQRDDGAPCAGARVTFADQDPARVPTPGSITAVPHLWIEARTKEDGTFEVADLVRPGTWHLDATEAGPHTLPFRVATSLARPVEDVSVVVEALMPAMAIEGRVVDDNDQPIARASVTTRSEVRGAKPRSATTDENGAFAVIPFRNDDLSPVQLVASRLRGGHVETPLFMPWGTKGVTLRIATLPTLELCVRDEHGAPVLAYTPRVAIPYSAQRTMPHGRRPTPTTAAPGPYPDGIARFENCPSGRLRLLLEFPEASGLAPHHAEIEVQRSGTTRIDLTASRGVELSLRTVDGSGQPIEGVALQICEVAAQELTQRTTVVDLRADFPSDSNQFALLLADGVTDADGRVRRRVPSGLRLGILAPGPKHVATVVDLGLLAADTERTLELQRGARLFGRIGPPAALAALRTRAGVGSAEPWSEPARPKLKLVPTTPSTEPLAYLQWPSVAVGEDGRFDARGLPSGDYLVRLEARGASSVAQAFQCELGPLHLADGSETEANHEITVPPRVRRTLRFVSNGVPVANVWATLLSQPPIVVMTNATGEAVVDVEPGSYDARVQQQYQGRILRLRTAMPVDLHEGGGDAPIEVSLPAARVRIRVVDANAKPVAKVEVHAKCIEATDLVTILLPTDASGRAETWLALGTHELQASLPAPPTADELELARAEIAARPPTISTPDEASRKAALESLAQTTARAFAAKRTVWHSFGTHAFLVAAPDEIELRLPSR